MVAPIKVTIDGNVEPLKNALGEAGKSTEVFGHKIETNLPPKMELVAKGVKVVAKGTKEVASAAKDAAAEEQIFADAMAAAGAATGDWKSQTDAAISSSMKLAFTDTETRKAITSLATATGDTASALDLLTVAQDVARLSGSSLESAADAVAKAQAGQDTALVRMLPGLEQGATAQETIANATLLAAGAADTYATSSAAMGEKAKIAFSEIAETVGQALGPSLKELGKALKPLLVAFLDLAQVILPPLLKLLERLVPIAVRAAEAITKIVNAVTKLIAKIRELLAPLNQAVDKLRQLDFNPFSVSGAAVSSATSISTRDITGAATTTGKGGVTINIYGDPAQIEARVIRALKSYQARNGLGSIITATRA